MAATGETRKGLERLGPKGPFSDDVLYKAVERKVSRNETESGQSQKEESRVVRHNMEVRDGTT